jgi:hypothetical protein
MQPTGLAVAAMRTAPAVFPNDGFKKVPTNCLIEKLFSKMVDVHTASSHKEFGADCINPM